MTQFEKSDGPFNIFEIDEIMQTARSLQHFANKVQKRDFFDAKDILLFNGTFVAIPVLLAFATELALKALLYRGGYKKSIKTHDLGNLYEKLDKEIQDHIEKKNPIPDPHGLGKVLGFDILPNHMPIRKLLHYHKDTFQEWRYLYENKNNGNMAFYHGALNRVLDAIVSVYYETYRRHQ